MWRVSRIDFYAALIALVSVLLLGILQGVLLAALASIFLLLGRASQPNIAFLGRLPGIGPLFRQRQARGRGAAGRHHRVPAGSVAALHQCGNGSGSGFEEAAEDT
jgi:MFS superfamily sulfate permease-like transporter